MATEANESTGTNTLVVRNPCFGLPTGCPQCLSAYIYLKLSHLPFNLDYHLNYPDSDQIPYFETGDCVAYNDEKDGIIECLKRDVGDLDGGVSSLPDWIPTKVILTTWLADALEYELWVGCDASSAYSIYYSDLPCPIGKVLFWKKTHWVKQKHGLNKDNAQAKEEEIYGRAKSAYNALSTWLGEQSYLFENRPSSLDAIFLAHALVVLQALPESSTLRMNFLEHANLVRYVQQCKTELIEAGTSSSDPYFHADPSSSASRGSKSKSRPKRKQQTKEEKTFRRRAKYFVVAQLVAVVLFLSIMPAYGDNADMELDDDYAGYGYDE
ncbi:mitochondrial outer membrane import complex protein METAXIN-like isoform X2 [Abrus precatorius]|uniref:Mitochondrial outer membrane import complex protein METAXIN-like isoform X2 n=1 Tax=Abrus precatorius TaxID=3816 RepID=A0A8B8K6R6_ABRPR|nr:mitochondrial outer membrane import complex protein METAXIN-like isoform X2 [Abrus precatorius]